MSDSQTLTEKVAEQIAFLTQFRQDVLAHFNDAHAGDEVRSRINRGIRRARELVKGAGCMVAVTMAPPAAIGGLLAQNVDPFHYILEDYYGMSLSTTVADMIEQAIGVLESPEYLERVTKANKNSGESQLAAANAMVRLIKLCERFPLVARQLQSRHSDRATIALDDEYDVQDLFHALLRIDFDDIRPEVWTPNYAGGSARMDFLLRAEQIVVEVKKTRASLSTRVLGDELLIDIARYKTYVDCKTLLCLVYDPELRIGNPVGFTRDLNGVHEGLTVRVIVTPVQIAASVV